MQIFSGEDSALQAIRCCTAAANETGQKHSIVALSDTELTVLTSTEAGAEALETISPVGQQRRW